MISIHHIISDAWTAGLIVNGIMDIYESLVKNNSFNENTSFSYLNYINSEQEYLSSPKFQKDAEFWHSTFDSIPVTAQIPSKKILSSTSSIDYACNRNEYILSKELVADINSYCKENSVSIFNFFMSIFAVYANKVCNLDDFVIGSPILNRTNFKEKNTTGMFISTMPYRIKLDSNLDFNSFVIKITP